MKILKISFFCLLCYTLIVACQPSKKAMQTAQTQYIQYCGACHGRNVEYLKEKDEWMFEKSYKSIVNVIIIGVEEKGMPGYSKTMTDQEIKNIAKFMMKKLKE